MQKLSELTEEQIDNICEKWMSGDLFPGGMAQATFVVGFKVCKEFADVEISNLVYIVSELQKQMLVLAEVKNREIYELKLDRQNKE